MRNRYLTNLTETSVRQALAVELQRAEVWVLIVVRVADWVQLKITTVFSFRDCEYRDKY